MAIANKGDTVEALAVAEELESPAFGFGIRRSIQLSYATISGAFGEIRTPDRILRTDLL